MILKILKTQLQQLASPRVAAQAKKFFKTGPGEYGEGDIFIGLRSAQLRMLAKTFSPISLINIQKLLKSKIHEERSLALLFLIQKFQKGDEETRKRIYQIYFKHTQYINGWDLVDLSAPLIVGPYLVNRSRKILYQLVKSKNLWERRIAMIATFYFIRQNKFDDALKISALLLQDQHDLIHKAVGWMLREIGKRDLKTEETFLKQYYRFMPRTMLRYAIERFPEKKRQSYLVKTPS